MTAVRPEAALGARLQFGILGPLEVRSDGEPLRISGRRQRALLALLLCDPNRVVSRERLIEELLADQLPDSADRMLRVQISRLRSALAAAGNDGRLLARQPGYVLKVEEGELDAQRFEQLAADGSRALEQQEFRSAAKLLREAEALWRGPPLDGLEPWRPAPHEIHRLEQRWLTVIEDRVQAELALGRHTALGPELESLVMAQPLRERLRAQLMLALYRSGRQADALEAYRAGRKHLVEELALEPGPELKELEWAILTQDPGLELHPPERHRTPPAAAVPDGPGDTADDVRGPKPHARGRRRAPVGLVAAAAAATALLAFAVALTVGTSAGSSGQPRAHLLALIPAGGGPPIATISLRASATDVAPAFGALWVAEPGAGLVVRVDPRRRRVVAAIPVGASPGRLADAHGTLWVLDARDHTLSGIDPATDSVARTIALEGSPTDVVSAGNSLWLAGGADGTVMQLNPVTGRTLRVVRTGGRPGALASAGDAVWVAGGRSGEVERIDAATAAVTGALRAGDAPSAVLSGAGGTWVVDRLDATASMIDPQRDVVRSTIPLGGAPVAIAQSGSSTWVADAQHGTLLRLDAEHQQVAARVHLGGHITALASTGPQLWLALDASGTSHRGGTLISATSYQVIDTVDPAAGTSNNVSPGQFLGMTNDGLVSVDHVPGPDGERLVPDLALSLPAPAGPGRSYEFRLRPGIRYSTGVPVQASDVTHSFERLFAIGSSGADWYRSIVGAGACLRDPAACDLSGGIVADDQARTVTFHLTRPDPDFLYELTLTYADVLPRTTPDVKSSSPLPATGPYQIARYVDGHEVVLTRNPRFREWSAAAQPDGYPDRVVLRLDLSGVSGAGAVASGAADLMANLGQIPGRYARYFLDYHRAQVHASPLLDTSFMFLNLRAAPFDDIRVRRALNLALDRRAIIASYGGEVAAQPTCQILPPGIPGYVRYCPYTRNHGPGGSWTAPDLARARRLVAASGTGGMNVTVWNTAGPPGAIAETEDAVIALRRLGYRASVRLLPASTYFTYTNDSRNRAQVIDGGWSADYGSPRDFIGKLTCGYFAPANGLATTDASELCDPAIDAQITRVASRQGTDAVAADASWARIDRELTDLAIWVPTVTPNEIDIVSRRVRNYQYNPVWGALLDQFRVH